MKGFYFLSKLPNYIINITLIRNDLHQSIIVKIKKSKLDNIGLKDMKNATLSNALKKTFKKL